MVRSERLNKPGDSWFSAKAIEVAPRAMTHRGRALLRFWGLSWLTKSLQTPNTVKFSSGDTQRVIRSVVERERAQTVC